VKKELAKMYAFIEEQTLRSHTSEAIEELLKVNEDYQDDESALVQAIQKQISEEIFVSADKAKIQA
jgi:hypothetical protein